MALGWYTRLVLVASFVLISVVEARTFSSSGTEVAYTYQTSFRSVVRADLLDPDSATQMALFHAAHLFGIFHSPDVAEQYGFTAELIEGFAGTKHPEVSEVRSFTKEGDPYAWVSYRGSGLMILLNHVARQALAGKAQGELRLPLLENLPAIYSDDVEEYRRKKWKKCTDSHYWTATDFSYFYNPFRCPSLGRRPLAVEVPITLSLVDAEGEAARVPKKAIDADNGNGKLTVLYFANGFDETPEAGSSSAEIQKDAGWKSYSEIGDLLIKKYGFSKIKSLGDLREQLGDEFSRLDLLTPVTLVHDTQRRYFSTYIKKTQKQIHVVRSALFDTDNEVRRSPLRSFPKFWKEAWENGDVIYFGGHSGDGQALSLDNMLDTLDSVDLDAIEFKPKKTQLALLDSCSSYAHYQDMYRARKPEGLHLVTFGLVSLFDYAGATIDGLLEMTLTQKGDSLTWPSALRLIEKKQLPAHVQSFYEVEDQAEVLREFQKARMYPSSLMSVWAP